MRFAVAVALVSVSVPARADSPYFLDAGTRDRIKACLDRTYDQGGYKAADGAKAAVTLELKCKDEFIEFLSQCDARSGRTERECSMLSLVLIETYIQVREAERPAP